METPGWRLPLSLAGFGRILVLQVLLLFVARAEEDLSHRVVVPCIPYLPRTGYNAELGAALLAFEDISQGNCGLIGTSCEAINIHGMTSPVRMVHVGRNYLHANVL